MGGLNSRVLFWQLFGIFAFNKADYILTLDFLDMGFHEANPIMASMVGTYEFHLVKLVFVPLLLLVLWQHRQRLGKVLTRLAWIPFVGYLSLMGYYRLLVSVYY